MEAQSSEEVVVIEWPEPEIAVVRLNRPERLNALTPEMVDEITSSIGAVGDQPGCRAVIVTGTGRGFCAGLDIGASVQRQHDNAEDRSVGTRLDGQERFTGMARAVRAARHPVIAAVNGPCAGAGMGLALACDIRIASPSASFHVAAVKIGLSAGECGISYHLPRHVGTARAFEVMLTGRAIDAEEAERWGLVSRVVPADELMPAALDTARAIAATSPFGSRMTKQVMWHNADADFGAALELENRTQILATLTNDFVEATRAFTEKRPPRFTGT